MSTEPATMAPKKANRCSQPRIRGRVSGCSQSPSAKSSAVQACSTRSPSHRTASTASLRGASSSAPSACTLTCSRSSGARLMLRGYGPVGWPAPGTRVTLPGSGGPCRTGARPAPTAGPRVTGVGVRSTVREAIVQVYERRLARALEGADIPRHVGVIMDGNRRWARAIGLEDVAHGHRRGADKIVDLLGWCDDAGVSVVTLFMLSTDNLSRSQSELRALLQIIEDVAVDLSRPGRPWRVRATGPPEVLPPETVAVLKQAEEDTRDRPGATVNLAVGYGGRREIADAVRSLLAEHAARGTSLEDLVDSLDVEHIAEHLYTAGQPDPDLVIRTSGEQRMSGFLLWQTANAEFHFTDVYWPDFRRVDFLRALRDYSARHRRFGG